MIPKDFTASVVTTAIESGVQGIGYWASTRAYAWQGEDYAQAVIMDKESERPHMYVLNHETIKAGIHMIMDRENEMALDDSYRHAVRQAVLDDDAGQIDGDLADQIVQAATLGDVIYG
jgi:hypothetical protein